MTFKVAQNILTGTIQYATYDLVTTISDPKDTIYVLPICDSDNESHMGSRTTYNKKSYNVVSCFFMVALWNRADHYIFCRGFFFFFFFLLSFFPRVISAVADWMSAILPHMVWP